MGIYPCPLYPFVGEVAWHNRGEEKDGTEEGNMELTLVWFGLGGMNKKIALKWKEEGRRRRRKKT